MKALQIIFICFTVLVGACVDNNVVPIDPPPPPPDPPKTYTVDLSWEPPTQYEDGTKIEYLKEYRVYYGNDPNYLRQGKILIVPGGVITFASLYVPKGDWHFAVTAVADNNLESDLSNIVTYSFS